ncbi:pyruvate dehydrogenase, putative [Perkinsus marinus ATCC 50983]|uniref:Protein-serine/threonine kinase n=1 Tax=Perkinsus marinus (strain ATCC 50983 / TXsc) TaxID=423536 RepID=C5L7F5_PERM5|nr:pyruvate dehydrogenase, putative [Perkinsus marinus ATCC 50983]EER07417.1 pyruvate dehydrogenase, putative [Perkinsus marinus ATCC 50983]|eukprot:XP_002775601.1 pyruvate dehydrogenase, putative [Perkinsus marinus ATCC 50983]
MGDDVVWSPEVKMVMNNILTRHKGTMIGIARGVLEFQESVRAQYDARCTLLHTRESVPAITEIERKLDDFFSTRISCRLIISHNAVRASVEKALFDNGGDYQRCSNAGLPPVAVTLPDLSSMWDSERTIKIADRGYGMKREILKKASSYFYSSASQKPDGTQELPDFDSRAPLAGFGFGLPISTVMAR